MKKILLLLMLIMTGMILADSLGDKIERQENGETWYENMSFLNKYHITFYRKAKTNIIVNENMILEVAEEYYQNKTQRDGIQNYLFFEFYERGNLIKVKKDIQKPSEVEISLRFTVSDSGYSPEAKNCWKTKGDWKYFSCDKEDGKLLVIDAKIINKKGFLGFGNSYEILFLNEELFQ